MSVGVGHTVLTSVLRVLLRVCRLAMPAMQAYVLVTEARTARLKMQLCQEQVRQTLPTLPCRLQSGVM
jgi:hypothetical protein